jgi:hypothetical protein
MADLPDFKAVQSFPSFPVQSFKKVLRRTDKPGMRVRVRVLVPVSL